MYFEQVISKLHLSSPKRNFSHVPYVPQMAVKLKLESVLQWDENPDILAR